MNWFLIGKILKPRGLKGEVKVKLATTFPEQLKKRKVWLGKNVDELIEKQILSVSVQSDIAYMMLDGVNSIEDAETFRDFSVYTDKAHLPKLAKNQAYAFDLIGLEVFDESDVKRGTVIDVLKLPACDTYEIELADEKKVLIPAVEEFIALIDVENKKMVVRRIDEFL